MSNEQGKWIELKERIREYFLKSDWDYKFNWNDGNRYGAKYESIKSLSRELNCPNTSLYIPLKELHKEGFIQLSIRPTLATYERVIESNQAIDKTILP